MNSPSRVASYMQRTSHSEHIVFGVIGAELKRQQEQIELIASENIVSPAVLAAQGSVLTK